MRCALVIWRIHSALKSEQVWLGVIANLIILNGRSGQIEATIRLQISGFWFQKTRNKFSFKTGREQAWNGHEYPGMVHLKMESFSYQLSKFMILPFTNRSILIVEGFFPTNSNEIKWQRCNLAIFWIYNLTTRLSQVIFLLQKKSI